MLSHKKEQGRKWAALLGRGCRSSAKPCDSTIYFRGGNAEALDGLFQRVDVHGLGQMRVHPGFLALLLDFYFTENKCKLFIRMNFFVFLIVFNVFSDSID